MINIKATSLEAKIFIDAMFTDQAYLILLPILKVPVVIRNPLFILDVVQGQIGLSIFAR